MKILNCFIFLLILSTIGCQSEREKSIPVQSAGSGDYLQISLSVKDLGLSLNFYSRLGFKILTAQKTVPVPWAIISDGMIIFMLSQNEFPSPAVIYYTDHFDQRIQTVQNFQLIPNDNKKPRTAISNDPNGIGITLINLKSQDLPRKPVGLSILPGSFKEISIPTLYLEESRDFWSGMGFQPQPGASQSENKMLLSDNLLTIGLYPKAGFQSAALTYLTENLSGTNQKLQSAGLETLPIRSGINSEIMEIRLSSPDGQLFRIMSE